MRGQIVTGFFKGAGAALNVPLGFVPDVLELINAGGATPALYKAYFNHPILKFDDADAGEIMPGDFLESSGDGSGYVDYVVLETGTWEVGGAGTGYIVFKKDNFVPGWDHNDVINRNGVNMGDAVGTCDYAVGNVAGAPATFTANELVTPYHGTTAGDPKGFTVAAAIAVDGEIVRYSAIREGE